MYGHTLLKWKAVNYISYPKTHRWYIIAGLLALLVVVYGVLYKDVILSILFLTLAGVYFLVHQKDDKLLNCELTSLGLKIDDKLYLYKEIEFFHFIYDPKVIKALYFKPVNAQYIRILLDEDIDIASMKEIFLAHKVSESEKQQESLNHVFGRVFRL